MATQIKIERPDEAEINELAKKMIEQNKVKMMNQVGLNPIGMVRVQMNHLGQLVTVQNSNPSNGNNAKKPQGGGLALDEESRKGRCPGPVALGSSLEALKWELRLRDRAGMVSRATQPA